MEILDVAVDVVFLLAIRRRRRVMKQSSLSSSLLQTVGWLSPHRDVPTGVLDTQSDVLFLLLLFSLLLLFLARQSREVAMMLSDIPYTRTQPPMI